MRSAPPLIVWMSFRLAIPWRVALPQWDTRPMGLDNKERNSLIYAEDAPSVGS
jgi:hypothetical protein